MHHKPYRDHQGAAPWPQAYFITFRCYGTWLPGDQRGSVDRHHNVPGEPLLEACEKREAYHSDNLRHAPFVLDHRQAIVVDSAIREVCAHRGWELHALNVRTNHVHVVVTADCGVEHVMTSLKSWSTRHMRERGLLGSDTKPWSRHGSTRYLWDGRAVRDACAYTIDAQGDNFVPAAP